MQLITPHPSQPNHKHVLLSHWLTDWIPDDSPPRQLCSEAFSEAQAPERLEPWWLQQWVQGSLVTLSAVFPIVVDVTESSHRETMADSAVTHLSQSQQRLRYNFSNEENPNQSEWHTQHTKTINHLLHCCTYQTPNYVHSVCSLVQCGMIYCEKRVPITSLSHIMLLCIGVERLLQLYFTGSSGFRLGSPCVSLWGFLAVNKQRSRTHPSDCLQLL